MGVPQTKTKLIPALIYCRVSTTKQRIEGSGLESQEHRCRQHAEAKGHNVEMVFPDDASGGGDFLNRPGTLARIPDYKINRVDDLLPWKITP